MKKSTKVDNLIKEQLEIGRNLDSFLMNNLDKMTMREQKKVDLYTSVASAHLELLKKITK